MDTGGRVRWSDIGKSEKAGDYRVGGIIIGVLPQYIEEWRRDPEARFCVIVTEELEGRFYSLGARAR